MRHLIFLIVFPVTILFAFPDILILFTYFQKDGITICINNDFGEYLEQEIRYFFKHDEKLGWKYIKTVGDYDKKVVFIENARKKCDEYKDDTEKVLKEMTPLIIQEQQIFWRNFYITCGTLGGMVILLFGAIVIRKKNKTFKEKR